MARFWDRKALGPLERTLLELLWARGESMTVQSALDTLERPLAYTTVMTTLDRMFKKGILVRTRVDRAFLYSARYTPEELRRHDAQEFVGGYLTGESGGGLLMSYLVDAVGGHDADLLDELEALIRKKKRELGRRKTS
jgi:predicted transcriptional regulator